MTSAKNLFSMVADTAEFMIVSMLEMLAVTNLRYLHAFPKTPACVDSVAWKTPRTSAFDPDGDHWCDVPTIVERGHANNPSLTAWRAAELLSCGHMLAIQMRMVERSEGNGGKSFGYETGIAVVILPREGMSNKVRRRVRRLSALRRRGGSLFSPLVPSIPVAVEWHGKTEPIESKETPCT